MYIIVVVVRVFSSSSTYMDLFVCGVVGGVMGPKRKEWLKKEMKGNLFG